MKRVSTSLVVGFLTAALWAALPETSQANPDDTIDVNLNNVTNSGSLTVGINLAGGTIGNKLAKNTKSTGAKAGTAGTQGNHHASHRW